MSVCVRELLRKSLMNFIYYSKYSVIPIERGQFIQNSFYKSVFLIDGFIGCVKYLFGIMPLNRNVLKSNGKFIYTRKYAIHTLGLINASLCVLLLVSMPIFMLCLFLAYWPKKYFSHNKPKSFLSFTADILDTPSYYYIQGCDYINLACSFIFSAVIWLVALLITPLVWVGYQLSSKFNNKSDVPSTLSVEEVEELQSVISEQMSTN